MTKRILHFSLGRNIGSVLLDIAQNNIENCDFDKAFTTYTDSLHGFTKELVLKVLKGECVVVCNEDGSGVTVTNEQEAMDENKMYLRDWQHQIRKLVENIDAYRGGVAELKNKLRRYYVDMNDINLSLLEVSSSLATCVARFVAGEVLDERFTAFHELLDKGDFDYDSLWKDKQILYCTIRYIEIMRFMYSDFIRLNKLYEFLRENEMTDRYPLIEHTMECTLQLLEGFMDKSNSYHHPICNDALAAKKDEMMGEVLKTKYGKEYFENCIIAKNILDGYDAGYLAPDGKYYGLFGETKNLLHVELSDMLTKKLYSDINGLSLDKEYELMKRGFMKVHHDNVYGYYAYNKDEADQTGKLYCPTEAQVNAIYEYANKFYGGKINASDTGVQMVSVSAIRQMDEVALRNLFM